MVFPPQRRWCRLEPGLDIPMDRKPQAQAILELYGEKMFSILRQSNFDIAMGEFLLDLAGSDVETLGDLGCGEHCG